MLFEEDDSATIQLYSSSNSASNAPDIGLNAMKTIAANTMCITHPAL